MSPQERNSWYTYREGIDPSMLTIGSMVYDYANPKDYRPYRHALTPGTEAKQWILYEPRQDISLTRSASKAWGFGGGLLQVAELDNERRFENSTTIIAKNGMVEELRDPTKFLNEQVLGEYRGQFWLSSRLAISRKLHVLRKMSHQQPRIWLLTRLLKIEDAYCCSRIGRDASQSMIAAVPADPTGISQVLGLNPGAKFHLKNGIAFEVESRFPEEKVWAAQYQRLDVRYMKIDSATAAKPGQVKLLNVFSSQETRGESDAAELTVADVHVPVEEGESYVTSDEPDKGYRDSFDMELLKLREELEGDDLEELGDMIP